MRATTMAPVLLLEKMGSTFEKIFLLSFLLNLQYSTCLRDLELSLPPAVSLGGQVNLSCHYHLQGENLYTLKLYKGRHEFLQLVPEKKPPLKRFPLKGLTIKNVSLSGSGATVTGIQLTLKDVNLFTTGLYGCEASADNSFHTELVRKYMTVLVEPENRPLVRGFKSRYRVGDSLNLTCIVEDTFPAANITWFISGKKIKPGKHLKSYLSTSPTSGLLTAYSEVTMQLRPHHFHKGHLGAKCVASMLTSHWQSIDLNALEEKPATLAAASNKKQGSKITNNNHKIMATNNGEKFWQNPDS